VTPEQRLTLIEDLKTREHRNVGRARLAAWGSVLLAAFLTGGLLFFGYWRLGRVNTEIQAKLAQLDSINQQLDQARKDRELAQTGLRALRAVAGEIPKAEFQAGLERAVEKDPNIAKAVGATVFIQTPPGDPAMQRAQEMQRKLRQAGFLVPGIEVVRVMTPATEVRYYKSTDTAEAEKVADVLRAMGETVEKTKHLTHLENNPTARAHHFEVWVGPPPKR
jgi:hypothetical protein